MKQLKKILSTSVLLFCCILSVQSNNKMLFSISTAKTVGQTIYPNINIAEGKRCNITVDRGDGQIVEFEQGNYSYVDVKGKTLTFYCDHPENITFINVSFSKAIALDFSGAIACKEINMFANQLSAEAMKACVESLPQTTNAKITVKRLDFDLDKTVVYKSHVKIANSKGWTVYAFKDVVEKKEPYQGDEADNISYNTISKIKTSIDKANKQIIVFLPNKQKYPIMMYSIDGYRLKPNMITNENSIRIDCSKLPNSIYILRISSYIKKINF